MSGTHLGLDAPAWPLNGRILELQLQIANGHKNSTYIISNTGVSHLIDRIGWLT